MNNPMQDDLSVLYIGERGYSGQEIVNAVRENGYIKKVVSDLLLKEALKSIDVSNDESEEQIAMFAKQQGVDINDMDSFLSEKGIDYSIAREIAERPLKVVKFREERWGSRVDSLYLDRKEDYDLVTFKALQAHDQDVMQEVYFRLKDGEETWEEMARQIGGGVQTEYKYGPTPVSKVNDELVKLLRSRGNGRVCRPVKIREIYVVAELEEFVPSKLDDELKTRVLQKEMESWLERECDRAMATLRFK